MFGWIKEYKRKKLLKLCRSEVATGFINLSNITSLGFIFAITSQESLSDLMDVYRFLKFKGIPFKGLAIETQKNVFPRVAPQKRANSQQADGANSQQLHGAKPQPVIPDEIAQALCLKVIPYEKLNWVGVVDEEEVKDFFASQTDLFISFNSSGCFTLDHTFASYVKSPMRVGMENNPEMPYSLVFEGKDKSILSPVDYLNQIFHYLHIIKTK